MKSFSSVVVCVFFFISSYAQNVGIGTPTPAERLDVNGNINVNGTIKVNGTDGTAGQVLMKNNSGALVWGNPSEYRNFVSFSTPGNGNWTVPAGVTKVYVEMWGGGGGGSWYAGGGGGAYICGIINVTPGTTISYSVGTFGLGGTNAGTNGGSSVVSYFTAGITLTAEGGFGAGFTSPTASAGAGGSFGATGTTNFAGVNGSPGFPSTTNIVQSSSTAFHELSFGGHGGDAANVSGTGGTGSYFVYNITGGTVIRLVIGTRGSTPGGGGSSGAYPTIGSAATNLGGNFGGTGMVIIRY